MARNFGPDELSGDRTIGFPRKRGCVRDEMLADGGMVLYDTVDNQLITINPTGALIWEYCDGEHSLAMIVAEMRALFPNVPTVQDDVAAILRDLHARGFLDSNER